MSNCRGYIVMRQVSQCGLWLVDSCLDGRCAADLCQVPPTCGAASVRRTL